MQKRCACFIWCHVVSGVLLLGRPVGLAPQMGQPTHSAGQMLAQMSRQNGAPASATPAANIAPLQGGPSGGWPVAEQGAVPRPSFNNQVSSNSHTLTFAAIHTRPVLTSLLIYTKQIDAFLGNFIQRILSVLLFIFNYHINSIIKVTGNLVHI